MRICCKISKSSKLYRMINVSYLYHRYKLSYLTEDDKVLVTDFEI